MGRNRKTPQGKTRTTLLRLFQIEQMDDAAERLGCDFSDVIRASLDMLFPPDPEDIRLRTLAAIERNQRRLRQFSSDFIPVLISGWIGEEMMLPWELAKQPVASGLIEETARMLRRMEPIPPGTRNRPCRLPSSVLHDVVVELLAVLASPAVRVIKFSRNEPAVFLIASVVCPQFKKHDGQRSSEVVPTSESGPPEAQYQEPHAALSELIKHEQIMDVSAEYLGHVKNVLRCSAFRIDWKRCRVRAE